MEEEAAAMEKFRASASTSNPFAAAPPAGAEEAPNILDLFGVAAPPAGAAAAAAPPPAAAAAPPQAAAASDDLLQLSGNPFANMLNGKIIMVLSRLYAINLTIDQCLHPSSILD